MAPNSLPPHTVSPTPRLGFASLLSHLSPGFQSVRTFFRLYGQWFFVLIPYLAAWYHPFVWGWNEWTNPASPQFFQPFIPFLTALLFWTRRNRLKAVWQREQSRPHHDFWRQGNFVGVLLGCGLLTFSHLVQIKGLAVIGLVMIVAGVIYWVFGWRILRASFIPLAFMGLCIPPPDGAVNAATILASRITLKLLSLVLKVLRMDTIPNEYALSFPLYGYTIEYGKGESVGGSSVVFAAILCLWWRLYQKRRFASIASLVLLSFVVSLPFNFLRLLFATLVYRSSPTLGQFLATNPLVFVVATPIIFLFTLGLNRLLFEIQAMLVRRWRTAKRRSPMRSRKASVSPTFLDKAGDVMLNPIESGVRQAGTLWKRSERGTEFLLRRMTSGRNNPFTLVATFWKRSEQSVENLFRLLTPKKKRRRRRSQ